jgi:transcriptional regulator with XRE-family HTH domain
MDLTDDQGRETHISLADKIDLLFRTMRRPGQPEQSYRDVASAIKETGGPSISATYLWQLRKGDQTNPSFKILEAVANHFHVPTQFFSDGEIADKVEAQLELISSARDSQVVNLAMRANGLSSAALREAAGALEGYRRLENLPDTPAEQGS